MPRTDDILWFKQQFQRQIEPALRGTPFDLDMVVAVACQETGLIWQVLRKNQLSVDRLLELCVGDTIDESGGRRAFPRTKADLMARPNGQQMFEIARQALVDMAKFISGYRSAVKNPDKFCHGFGIGQTTGPHPMGRLGEQEELFSTRRLRVRVSVHSEGPVPGFPSLYESSQPVTPACFWRGSRKLNESGFPPTPMTWRSQRSMKSPPTPLFQRGAGGFHLKSMREGRSEAFMLRCDPWVMAVRGNDEPEPIRRSQVHSE